MRVRNWMTPEPITVEPDMSLVDADRLMKEYKIRCLPVMKGKILAGIVTDRDIKAASASSATSLNVHELIYLLTKLKVREIMSKPPVTIYDDDTVEEAAVVMRRHKISHLPVMAEGGDLVGIISAIDILDVLLSLTGIHKGGLQFGFELEDRSGSIKQVTDLLREHGGRIVSILTSYENAREGFRKVYIRVKGIDPRRFTELRNRLESVFRVLYVIESQRKHHIFPSSDETPDPDQVLKALHGWM